MWKASLVPTILLLTLLFSLQSVHSFQISLVDGSKVRTSLRSGERSLICVNMGTDIHEIKTKDAPAPVGPYSQAVLAGSTLYCSGNIALDPATGEIVGNGDVQAETRQVLKNMDAVLKAAGATAASVVRCTVFLADLADFGKVNEIYAEYFKENAVAPSRSCIQAGALPKGALVEIDCIAVL
jgi:2-iminobutanoate/2-iminopropanoate deaminase